MKQAHFFYFTLEGENTLTPITIRVNVNGISDPAQAAQMALEQANVSAAQKGCKTGVQPLLVVDIPDIRIVLNRGEVAAAYSRISAEKPEVSVYDFDYKSDPEAAAEQLSFQLIELGYERIPVQDHTEYDNIGR